ncbi:PEP-CTERM sorting domain-containing protein [Bryobacter aggregatus]|uniref:PEP-CTERM sorting domain-containing protein n=1 Tax=Bryobacter aggregatus TaxID=360054 RepID=UPI0004E0CC18|nr:PEP-CTERM sorting domain-containing protein [Bryobacter aggregatus]
MKIIQKLSLLFLMSTAVHAAILLQISPSPVLGGSAGTTVGWGFSLTSDPQFYISVIGSELLQETNPTLGSYVDWIGVQGGPVNFSLAPNTAPWIQDFDFSLGTGIGAYTFDPAAPASATNSGQIRILFEYYSDDPLSCGSCFVGSASATAAFQLVVTDPPQVPEPSTVVLSALGLGVGFALRRTGLHRSTLLF